MNKFLYYFNDFITTSGFFYILDWVFNIPDSGPDNMIWALGCTALQFLWDLYKGNKRP